MNFFSDCFPVGLTFVLFVEVVLCLNGAVKIRNVPTFIVENGVLNFTVFVGSMLRSISYCSFLCLFRSGSL